MGATPLAPTSTLDLGDRGGAAAAGGAGGGGGTGGGALCSSGGLIDSGILCTPLARPAVGPIFSSSVTDLRNASSSNASVCFPAGFGGVCAAGEGAGEGGGGGGAA